MKLEAINSLMLLLILCVLSSQAHSDEHRQGRNFFLSWLFPKKERGACHTHDPNARDYIAAQRATSYARFVAARKQDDDEEEEETVVIPVCFHNPSYASEFNKFFRGFDRHVSNEAMQQEIDHLNHAYSHRSCCDTALPWCNGECSINVNIRFEVALLNDDRTQLSGQTSNSTRHPAACITREQGHGYMYMDVMFRGGAEKRIKARMRRGNERTLNIYYVRSGTIVTGQALGFATFPWKYTEQPVLDGVVIEPTAIRGGSKTRFTEGDTTVHEVGYAI